MKKGRKNGKGNGSGNGKINGSENGKEEKVVIPGIELVLNGGKKEMDAATIPIQWFFSEEVIGKKPTHLVFFEQTEKESKYEYGNSEKHGRRYACKISTGTKFIQLFSPGYHRLMVLALGGEQTVATVKTFLKTEEKDYYSFSLSWEEIREGYESFIQKYGEYRGVMAAAIVEFSVPEELFAAKPKTAWQKAVWWWVNYMIDTPPRDQCAYRERIIMAFTFKPIVILISGFFIGLARIVGAIWILAASGFVWFFGWRPESVRGSLKKMMLGGEGYFDDVREYQWDRGYKLLDDWTGQKKTWAPWEIVLVLLAVACLYRIPNFFDYFIGLVAIVASSIVIAAYFIKLVHWFQEWRDNKKSPKELEERLERRRLEEAKWELERKAKWEKLYHDWLAKNFNLARKGNAVNLDDLPTPLGFGDRVVQMFQVNFWSLKAKVCRPYSR